MVAPYFNAKCNAKICNSMFPRVWKNDYKKDFFLKKKKGHVEEQIGRTNVEEYYYVSKLHS